MRTFVILLLAAQAGCIGDDAVASPDPPILSAISADAWQIPVDAGNSSLFIRLPGASEPGEFSVTIDNTSGLAFLSANAYSIEDSVATWKTSAHAVVGQGEGVELNFDGDEDRLVALVVHTPSSGILRIGATRGGAPVDAEITPVGVANASALYSEEHKVDYELGVEREFQSTSSVGPWSARELAVRSFHSKEGALLTLSFVFVISDVDLGIAEYEWAANGDAISEVQPTLSPAIVLNKGTSVAGEGDSLVGVRLQGAGSGTRVFFEHVTLPLPDIGLEFTPFGIDPLAPNASSCTLDKLAIRCRA